MRWLCLALVSLAACTSANPYLAGDDAGVVCPPGQYVVKFATPSSPNECAACPSGTFSTQDNAEGCLTWASCPAGSFSMTTPSATQDRTCLTCPDGTYTPQANLLMCLTADVCPAGTVISGDATTTTNTTCDACGPGHYCAGGTDGEQGCPDGTWDDDMNAATPCVDQTHCVAGQVIVSNGDARHDRTCDACPSGSFSSGQDASACTPYTTCAAPNQYVMTDGTASSDRVCASCPDPTLSSTDNSSTCDVPCRDTIPPVTLATDTGMQLALTSSCTDQTCTLTLDGSAPRTITATIAADPKQCASRTYGYAWTIRYNPNVLAGAAICSDGVSGQTTNVLSLAADALPDLSAEAAGDRYFDVELDLTTSAGASYDTSGTFGLTYTNSTRSTGSTPLCP